MGRTVGSAVTVDINCLDLVSRLVPTLPSGPLMTRTLRVKVSKLMLSNIKINLVLLSLKILIKYEEEHRIIPFIIQAKKFLKGDWLKRVVFQLNLKYLHAGISFPWPTDAVLSMAQKFLECMNAVYFNSVTMSTFRSEIVTMIPFRLGCIIYCLSGENGQ